MLFSRQSASRPKFSTPLFFISLSLAAMLVAPGCLDLPQAQAANLGNNSFTTPHDLRPSRDSVIDDIASKHGLNRQWVANIIQDSRILEQIPPLMLPPSKGSAKNWQKYRSQFVNDSRIRAGLRFWLRNRKNLERAEQQYGVPAEIIVGILGVETNYGQNMGNTRILDALSTLTFNFPEEHPRARQRQAYFQGELGNFLKLSHDQGLSVTQSRGSYAGAMGIPQFMPGSWQQYAIDFDQDGRIDLLNSEADAIGSVANYFKQHGWINGMPTHYEVEIRPDAQMPRLLEPDILPTFTPEEFADLGVQLKNAGPDLQDRLALIELPNGDPEKTRMQPDYVAGTQNFYVVTRYNQSSNYAMAVIELGREIAKLMP